MDDNEIGVVEVGLVGLEATEKWKASTKNYKEVAKHLRGIHLGGDKRNQKESGEGLARHRNSGLEDAEH